MNDGQAKTMRYAHLDGLRGVAAVVVMVTHVCMAFWPSAAYGIPANDSRFDFVLQRTPLAVLVNGHAAVILFFTLSGFVLSKKYFRRNVELPAVAADIGKRFFRLAMAAHPAAVASSLLLWTGAYAHHQVAALTLSPRLASFPDTCTSAFLTKSFINPVLGFLPVPNPVGWTLMIEFWASYAVFCLVIVVAAMPARVRLLAYCLLVLLIRAASLEDQAHGFLAYFVLGVACADRETELTDFFHRRCAGVPAAVTTCLAVGGFLALAAIPHYARPAVGSYLPWPIMAAMNRVLLGGPAALLAIYVFLMALVATPVKRVLQSSWPTYLGAISVGLYLVHLPILYSLGCHAFLFLRLSSGWNEFPAKCVAALAVGATSLVIGQLYSRMFDDLAVHTSRRIGAWIEGGFASTTRLREARSE